MIERFVAWLFYWSRMEKRIRHQDREGQVGYRMYRRGFLYKEGRVNEAVPTWMVNHERNSE